MVLLHAHCYSLEVPLGAWNSESCADDLRSRRCCRGPKLTMDPDTDTNSNAACFRTTSQQGGQELMLKAGSCIEATFSRTGVRRIPCYHGSTFRF